MKLKSVKILGDNFRSLQANKLYEFNVNHQREDRLSTKIFAGLNGSGKSNFLELFSEIFYFLEVFHLSTVSDEEKRTKAFGFEIEYFLPMVKPSPNGLLDFANATDFDLHVRIIKPLGAYPEFSIKKFGKHHFERQDKGTEFLLPTKIIAYTSGQNELLSNPYYKIKYHYFKTFEDKKKLDEGEELAENHRLFFLDYSTNFSIFVANVLLSNGQKSEFLKEALKINNLQSFRITINTDELNKRVIPINATLAENIQKLKLCSTSWVEKKVGKNSLLVIDYLVNSATKEAFLFHFKNAFSLFKVFYELEIFNLYLVQKKTRDLMLQVHKTYNFSDEMAKPDPSRLVFRIEKVMVNKTIDEFNNQREIYYKALSDGEHQFNEIFGMVLMMEQAGCLFLIDEPDTHFNPKWGAKLIKTLNLMAASSFDSKGNIEKVRTQEIIITTHSPFVISDSSSEDVYHFVKTNGFVEYSNPTVQMYGASISVILDEIFEKEETISEMAKKELKEMVENITTLEELRVVVDRLNTDFGDSVEKFDLFSKLRNIKTEIEKKKN